MTLWRKLMNFERGKEVKEAVRIGKAANPFVAIKGKVSFKKKGAKLHMVLPLVDGTVHHYLSEMRSNVPLIYIADNWEGKGRTRESKLFLEDENGKITAVEDLRGEYVLFQDKLYGICVEPLTIKSKLKVNMQW